MKVYTVSNIYKAFFEFFLKDKSNKEKKIILITNLPNLAYSSYKLNMSLALISPSTFKRNPFTGTI